MVTVVIASYKYGHLAAHCIESILSQTRRPDRILFVDDGVGDCKHLPKLYPEVEFVFRRKNLGIVDNFNDMLQRVTTQYVMFLGADNWLRSDALERLLEAKADIVTYDIMVTGELKSEIGRRHPKEVLNKDGDVLWKRDNMHHGSILYRTDLGKMFGYKGKESGKTEEDRSLWQDMIDSGAHMEYIPEPFLYYRRHKENFYNYERN